VEDVEIGPALRRRFLQSTRTIFLVAAAFFVAFAALLIITGYSKCPFSDEWAVISGLAQGVSPLSISWLWSQHNEHRILIPRLLISLDAYAFGARNISLFIGIYLVQVFHWLLFAGVSRSEINDSYVRTTFQCIWAAFLFLPTQLENLTWAFQISFVLPFFLASSAFACIGFYDATKRSFMRLGLSFFCIWLAMCNLAAGMMIWPVLLLLCWLKRLDKKTFGLVAAVALASLALYFTNYRRPPENGDPLASLMNPVAVSQYVMNYLGSPWVAFSLHKGWDFAALSFLVLAGLLAHACLHRDRWSNLELFLLSDSVFIFLVSCVTALGRLNLGIGQSGAGRYHTPSSVYWASLLSLALVRFHRFKWRRSELVLSGFLALVMILFVFRAPRIWRLNQANTRLRNSACEAIEQNRLDLPITLELYKDRRVLEEGSRFLHERWRRK
jgi:hypothetical protein